MSWHDRHLAQYSRETVEVSCRKCADRGIESRWLATLEREYGASWLSDGREDCPNCGASGDDLDTETADPADYDPRL